MLDRLNPRHTRCLSLCLRELMEVEIGTLDVLHHSSFFAGRNVLAAEYIDSNARLPWGSFVGL
ncbi:hypothetical protein G6O69_07405 [Pseudenhygromyxa sp. WMMC2535]|uniref:hypothetical protein n=1 Tax=Pseudenhygromyxa sp. WMMC2535 TaxID=2712867 RepID=UPI00159611CA|nr:hypothetical protein [Pseudenhygromyxa sp. WMMC2535]NVB37654.1 hypothetical protein [Pseudenhygromyxa sp. WMMC2535]